MASSDWRAFVYLELPQSPGVGPFGDLDLGKPQDLLRSKSCDSIAALRHTPAAD